MPITVHTKVPLLMASNSPVDNRLEKLMDKASGVCACMKDSHSMPMAMKRVGFTEEEAKERHSQQRV